MLKRDAINSAIKRYDKLKEEDYLINPISKADIEIIKELVIILDKLGRKDVVAIMDNYKYSKDIDIHEELIGYNTDFLYNITDEDLEEVEKELQTQQIFTRDFVKIKDGFFELSYIHSCDRINKWDIDKDKMKYILILNKTNESYTTPPYANTEFEYYSEVERDDVYMLILQELQDSRRINFIN